MIETTIAIIIWLIIIVTIGIIWYRNPVQEIFDLVMAYVAVFIFIGIVGGMLVHIINISVYSQPIPQYITKVQEVEVQFITINDKEVPFIAFESDALFKRKRIEVQHFNSFFNYTPNENQKVWVVTERMRWFLAWPIIRPLIITDQNPHERDNQTGH